MLCLLPSRLVLARRLPHVYSLPATQAATHSLHYPHHPSLPWLQMLASSRAFVINQFGLSGERARNAHSLLAAQRSVAAWQRDPSIVGGSTLHCSAVAGPFP